MFFGYIKDCDNITAKPKSFIRISTLADSSIKRDLLTDAKSTFSIMGMPSNVNIGDILSVYDGKGKEWYTGKIISFDKDKITCSQIQSILSGVWLCSNYEGSTLELEIKHAIEELMSGRIGELTDQYIANKYKDFSVSSSTSTVGHLPTYEDGDTLDFDKFIYQMYTDYGVIINISIPYEGNCFINVSVPEYSTQVIADNTQAINSVNSVLKVNQNNKLVIFDKEKTTYRATYVVSADAEPQIYKLDDGDVLNRFIETKTKIVFSDDELDTIVSANLNTDIYNHKLTFDMLLNNKLYSFDDLKLGQPLEIWNGTDFFRTIMTGYEITIPANSNPTHAQIICGKVRTSLTDILKIGVANG